MSKFDQYDLSTYPVVIRDKTQFYALPYPTQCEILNQLLSLNSNTPYLNTNTSIPIVWPIPPRDIEPLIREVISYGIISQSSNNLFDKTVWEFIANSPNAVELLVSAAKHGANILIGAFFAGEKNAPCQLWGIDKLLTHDERPTIEFAIAFKSLFALYERYCNSYVDKGDSLKSDHASKLRESVAPLFAALAYDDQEAYDAVMAEEHTSSFWGTSQHKALLNTVATIQAEHPDALQQAALAFVWYIINDGNDTLKNPHAFSLSEACINAHLFDVINPIHEAAQAELAADEGTSTIEQPLSDTDLLTTSEADHSVLAQAIENCDIDQLITLHTAGIDINTPLNGQTPLSLLSARILSDDAGEDPEALLDRLLEAFITVATLGTESCDQTRDCRLVFTYLGDNHPDKLIHAFQTGAFNALDFHTTPLSLFLLQYLLEDPRCAAAFTPAQKESALIILFTSKRVANREEKVDTPAIDRCITVLLTSGAKIDNNRGSRLKRHISRFLAQCNLHTLIAIVGNPNGFDALTTAQKNTALTRLMHKRHRLRKPTTSHHSRIDEDNSATLEEIETSILLLIESGIIDCNYANVPNGEVWRFIDDYTCQHNATPATTTGNTSDEEDGIAIEVSPFSAADVVINAAAHGAYIFKGSTSHRTLQGIHLFEIKPNDRDFALFIEALKKIMSLYTYFLGSSYHKEKKSGDLENSLKSDHVQKLENSFAPILVALERDAIDAYRELTGDTEVSRYNSTFGGESGYQQVLRALISFEEPDSPAHLKALCQAAQAFLAYIHHPHPYANRSGKWAEHIKTRLVVATQAARIAQLQVDDVDDVDEPEYRPLPEKLREPSEHCGLFLRLSAADKVENLSDGQRCYSFNLPEGLTLSFFYLPAAIDDDSQYTGVPESEGNNRITNDML